MSQTTERIHELEDKRGRYRHEYYNEDAPSVSDAVYDHLYDELARAEKETGIILSTSPTQTVGYKAVSSLEKVRHRIPLLSLDKIHADKWLTPERIRELAEIREQRMLEEKNQPVQLSLPLDVLFP